MCWLKIQKVADLQKNFISQVSHDSKFQLRMLKIIVNFSVVCLVAKPLNRSKAKVDLVMTQTLLLFKCKLLCYHANKILVSITTWSPSASLQIESLATKYTTVNGLLSLIICLIVYSLRSIHKNAYHPRKPQSLIYK